VIAAEAQKYGMRCITDESQHFPKLFDLKTHPIGKVYLKKFWERQHKNLAAYSDSELWHCTS
jgi:hypothetical protein